jgi:hypothetical protein
VLGKAQQNVVCIINGMLRKMKTVEQSTPLNEMLICSICLTTDTRAKMRMENVVEYLSVHSRHVDTGGD